MKSIKFATEAAITILRIDDMIKLDKKKEEMPGRHWNINRNILYKYSILKNNLNLPNVISIHHPRIF